MNEQPIVPEPIAFSNSIRLSARQWLGVALFAVVLVNVAPTLWQRYENFTPDADFRIPHALSEDYWLYERHAEIAAERCDTLVIGDSVVWGVYAHRNETLSHYLNVEAGQERFANLGLEGAHPLALSGLVRHYAGSVRNRNVVLQCNPLWLRSLMDDLQEEKRINEFNHPRLVPQFWPTIPRYRKEVSDRLGVLVEQRSEFNSWTGHLQSYYKDAEASDMPGWTLKHPYENPLEPLTRGLPASDDAPAKQQPWAKRSADYDWIDLDTSLQWHAFQETVELLQARGNRVFVVVGPFNEHMLTQPSLARYQKVKSAIDAWLTEKQIPHVTPPPLPSEQYGDASHPLPAGYAALAKSLYAEPFFKDEAP